MAVTDISADIKKRRQQKKTKRFLKKLIVILVIAVIALSVVSTRSLWYPKLNGILNKIPTTTNSAELAEGYFPLSIEGGASYQLDGLDSGICVLDDSRYFTYNLDGKPLFTAQHTFANPILTTSSKKALIYDLGGKSFRLMTKYKQVYEIKTEAPILLARISGNDYSAVVTKSEKFMASLMIYDANGNNIFNYSSVNRIIDICFNADNDGCYITTLGSKGGILVSEILYYKFNKINYDSLGNPEPIWKSGDIETLALNVKTFGSDKIIVIGDTKCEYFDTNGILIDSYSYDRDLKDYEVSSGLCALIFDDTERRCSTLVTIDSVSNETAEIPLDFVALNVDCVGDTVYIHSRTDIFAFNSAGEMTSTAELLSDYDDFVRIDKYIFLLGYDEINRIDYN